MSFKDGHRDPYCYPGTEVLINKFGITDDERLTVTEYELARHRIATMPYQLPIDTAGYRAIHRHIFSPLYAWAGEYRSVPVGRMSSLFALPPYIAPEMEKRFALIAAENNLRGLSADAFAASAAGHAIELNAIHPFREGNGRTLRAFLQILARQAGHALDLTTMTPRAWNEASRIGFQSLDSAAMRAVLRKAMAVRKRR